MRPGLPLSPLSAPDLTASFMRFACIGDTLLVVVRIGNGGAIAVGPGLPVSFYHGDPASGGPLLGTVPTAGAMSPGRFEDVTLQLTGVCGTLLGPVTVVADDPGDSRSTQRECNEANNAHTREFTLCGDDDPSVACDDGNPCTDDECVPASGCFHTNNATTCNDGNACTTNDTCAGGTCVGGPLLPCDDQNVCTTDACVPSIGCQHAANDGPCDDGSVCTTQDTCSGGACVGTVPLNCDDGIACTDDSCDAADGCLHFPLQDCCPAPPAVTCTQTNPCDSLPSADRCPDGTPVTESSVLVEPESGTVCAGDSLLVSLTRHGEVTRTVVSTDDVCDGACFDACFATCVQVPLQRCYNHCVRRCSNGACLQWETRCAVGDLVTDCDVSCFEQCEQTFDPVTRTSTFVQACGQAITETLDLRQSGEECAGPLVESYALSGVGTAGIALHAPLTPGNYVLCLGADILESFAIEACGPRCRVRLDTNEWPLTPGGDRTFAVGIESSAGGGEYSVSLLRFEDDAHTIPLSVPGFLSAPPTVEVPDGGTASFWLSATNPRPIGVQTHWSNVIVRAVGPATCEAPLDVTVLAPCAGQPAGAPCGDATEQPCDGRDVCDGVGNCVPNHAPAGTPCGDDGNLCTDDACDGAGACGHAPHTASCDDGNACTTDRCEPTSGCVYAPVTCLDGNSCTDDTCDPASGCLYTPDDTNGCTDDNPCTTDACFGGTCAGTAIDCDDRNSCTDDRCDSASGCVHVADDTNACSDGNSCTTDECVSGRCRSVFLDCHDSNDCTNDSCEPASGCVHVPVVCQDGNACTTDACNSTGGCTYTTIRCNDGDLCTNDACNAVTGCVFSPVTCNDGNACTTDACDPVTGCTHTTIECHDANECTNDSCNPTRGCTFVPVVCNDDNACTTDSCDSKSGCRYDGIRCVDSNPCTDDSCDVATGCMYTPDNTNVCTDGNACTADACVAGQCASTPIACDDSSPCTDDTCNPATGCLFTPDDTNSCTDGDACTTDACAAGQCTGTMTVCDDNNACTDDTCAPATGCRFTPDDSNACSDGNRCTTDSCQAGRCVGAPVVCDDGNPCTDETCEPASGCELCPRRSQYLFGRRCVHDRRLRERQVLQPPARVQRQQPLHG